MASLGADGRAWRRLIGPLLRRWDALLPSLLGPLIRPPRHPIALAGFGLRALWPATLLARRVFDEEPARALFAGLAAHAILDLGAPLTSSFGLMMAGTAHAEGWPAARGGSQRIADALVSYLGALGGQIVTGHPVERLADLPPARVALFDLTPRQIVAIAGDRLAPGYRARLERYRYGSASFKVDYALDGPVPKTFRRGTHRASAPDDTLARVRPFARQMGVTRLGNVITIYPAATACRMWSLPCIACPNRRARRSAVAFSEGKVHRP